MEKRGEFIVLEGLDGSGSTTQAKLLCNYLFDKSKSNVPVLTREPTELTAEGREIRRRLKGNLLPHEEVINDFLYWANLFLSDRKWHVLNIVGYNTERGLTVISDRYSLSTFAYQSAQGGQMEQLIAMHEGLKTPNLTLFLHVPVEIALERIMANREGTPEFFEKKEFLKQTAKNYERAILLLGQQHNIIVIDGTLSVEEVHKLIRMEVDKLYD